MRVTQRRLLVPTLALSCLVPVSASAQPGLTNQACANSSKPDPVSGNDCNTAATSIVSQADLQISKDDGVTTAVAGGSVTYTIVATNAGPSTDPSVSVADTFPSSLTCSWTSVAAGGATGNTNGSGNLADTLSMPPGSSVTYTVTCNIDPSATGTLSNTATVAASVTDPDSMNDSGTDGDTVLTMPVPTLSEIGLLVLFLMVAVAGGMAIRRRAHHT